MAKKLKVKCDQVTVSQQQGQVRFIIEDKANNTAPPVAPGQPPRRLAKTIVTVAFSGDQANQAAEFTAGKEYTVTIE